MGDAAQWVRGLIGHHAPKAARRPPAEPRPPSSSASVGAVAVDRTAPQASGWQSTWRVAPALAAGLAALGIVAIHWQTAASVVAIWIRSETFTHGFVVVPICLWLAWRRRDALAAVPARPWWPGLVLVLAAGLLWLLAVAAGALGARQFALAFTLQAAIVTVVGGRVARAAIFPLTFLLFAVPFGEIFVPTLIEWTADFTVSALRWSGVPVYREANLFIIPSGAWSVVEACSGIRYIIASVMIGTIYAAIAYRSARRRALFMAAAVLVPIVANWLRAYMIVMIGHLSNNRLAVGVDHIIYGWVFFGLVMLLLFWAGSFWQQDDRPDVASGKAPNAAALPVPASSRSLFAAAAAAIVVAAIWVPVGNAIDRSIAPGTPRLAPIAATGGWSDASRALIDWKPQYKGFVAERQQAFEADGRAVGVYIAYYRGQNKGSELITSGNQLTASGDWKWKEIGRGSDHVDWAGRDQQVDTATLSGRTDLRVFRLYWIAGQATANPYAAKALQAWAKLTGRGDDAALIVLYAPVLARNDDPGPSLHAFARAMSPSIEQTLSLARQSR